MKNETRLTHLETGQSKRRTVNPSLERASTLLHPTREALYEAAPNYGRMGLSVHRELEDAVGTLENAEHVKLTSNGLQACALAIAAPLKSGDHILFTDSIYGPTNRFCTRRLARMGISSTRFNPTLGEGLEALIQENTKAIMLESPGSLTFDISDTRAIVALAKTHNLITISDNTWGAGLLHKPLDLGVDISIQALTKYAVGHADAFGGAVMTNDTSLFEQITNCGQDWGISLAPEDAYTALRGLRTLPVRLKQHEATGYALADWISAREEIAYVLHPGRSDHPEHALWQRDFSGANGLFGAVMAETSTEKLDAFLEALNIFGMGFSWGGYESLIIPCCDQLRRLPDDRIHDRSGPLLRIHAGLEHIDDLIADLVQAFAAMAAA